MSREPVYFDHAATTPLAPEVLEAMLPYFSEHYGNPSSMHRLGVESQRAIDEARRGLASAVGAKPHQVVFTGGGTEGDVLALRGAVAGTKRERHVVINAIEHHAVLETGKSLERRGHRLTVVPVTETGHVSPDAVADAIEPETAVCAVMSVNNELGTVHPVAEIARRVKEKAPRCLVHVDAVQAFGRVPVGFAQWPEVDTIAVSAHKLYGPKGTGALFVREPGRLEPLLTGGGQEGGLRSGTSNVPGIVGLGAAWALAYRRRAQDLAHYQELFETLLERLDATLPDAVVNGGRDEDRVPYIVNLRVPGAPAEPLLHGLEGEGFLVSSGSACHSKSGGLSHVLAGIGLRDRDGANLRISFGRSNAVADVERFVEVLASLVPRMRAVAERA